MKVSPSIIAASFVDIKHVVQELEQKGADFIHLDVMDGVFVNNLTFGPDIAREILSLTKLKGDTHLMIQNPEKYLDRFLDTGTEILTFHIESEGNKRSMIRKIKEKGKKAGITLNPSTPLFEIEPYLNEVDLVLIMTVHPGFYGQKFKPEMVERLKEIKRIREERGLNFLIEVDGGINRETAPKVAPYVDIVVSGSFIFKGGQIEDNIAFLKRL